ncbi:hypothetical protein LTR49_024918 [Elasticomyces elasticus]|nr:hypothetical protein LTR49_024918 [Elasticomyces elasticus]
MSAAEEDSQPPFHYRDRPAFPGLLDVSSDEQGLRKISARAQGAKMMYTKGTPSPETRLDGGADKGKEKEDGELEVEVEVDQEEEGENEGGDSEAEAREEAEEEEAHLLD